MDHVEAAVTAAEPDSDLDGVLAHAIRQLIIRAGVADTPAAPAA